MLFLNKFLPVFFLPFGIACWLVLFALWRKKWWPGLLALAVLYVASMPVIANFLLGRLEALNPPVKLADAPPADAVYVLGGILSRLPREGELPSWSDSSERFDGGVELVKAGKAAWLILPGDRWKVDGRDWVEGDVLRDLAIARADGSLRALLARLSRIDVLVIDDWAMAPLAETERRDFWEICEDRYQTRSTILTSQLPVARWHEQIGDPTAADGILDRLVHNAHRIEMRGDSMRKKRSQQPSS